MKYRFDYSEGKNLVLKETRKVGFEDIIKAIKKGNLLEDLDHPSVVRRSKQRVLVVKIKNYAYVVPYVKNEAGNSVFLKTLYPSRKMTRTYLKKGKL
jgi:hypothetical protein